MRYFFWYCIHEIFLYPFVIAVTLPFYSVFEGEPWAVLALAVSLCLLSSLLTSYLGKSLITLTAANASVFASQGKLDKALNRLIYLSRLLPALRCKIREQYRKNTELNRVELMELAVECMRNDNSAIKPFNVVAQVLYTLGLLLAIAATLMKLFG